MRDQSVSESYAAFRTRLLIETILPTFLTPLLFTAILLRSASYWHPSPLDYLPSPLLYILSIPLSFVLRVQIVEWKQRREAERLGARMIPRIRGRWPGNLDILLRIMRSTETHYHMDWAKEMMEEAGSTTINTRLLWGNQYLTMDEKVVKYMLLSGFGQFDKGVDQKERWEDILRDSVINRDGGIWKSRRALIRPFFARDRLIDLEVFEKFTQKTLDVLSNYPKYLPIDIQDLFARFTLDAGSTFLFNTNPDTLSLPLPEAYKAKMGPKGSASDGEFGSFAHAFEMIQVVMSTRSRRRMVWKFFELFRSASDAHNKIIREYLDPLVRKALEEKQEYSSLCKEAQEEMSGSFLRYLAMSTEDVESIRFELITMLAALRDTTSALLTSAVYALTQHPEVLARLRKEILSICPQDHIPTHDDIRQLKYLKAFLNETLRLFPSIPANFRSVRTQSVAVPIASPEHGQRPLYIPAKASIAYFAILIHKRKDLWGPDAYQFDPDRWMDDGTGRMQRTVKNPFMFFPFSIGPRTCLGQQFGLNEASFFIIRLLQVYDRFELALDAQPEGSLPPAEWAHNKEGRASVDKVWHKSSITAYVKGGLWVKLHQASTGTTE